jgi:hypothetical protein
MPGKVYMSEEEAARRGFGGVSPPAQPIARDWWFQVTLQQDSRQLVYAVPHVPGFMERYSALLLAPDFVALTVRTSEGYATVERTTPT